MCKLCIINRKIKSPLFLLKKQIMVPFSRDFIIYTLAIIVKLLFSEVEALKLPLFNSKCSL